MHQDNTKLIEAGWDPTPRWLRHTGLPTLLGIYGMAVLELLMRRALSRRNRQKPAATPEGQVFPPHAVAYTRSELAGLIACSEASVKRGLGMLRDLNVVETLKVGYQHPSGAAPSWAAVDLKLLQRVYVVTCSELPTDVGGIRREHFGDAEEIDVQVYQGPESSENTVRLSRGLVSCGGEVPVVLVEALCKSPLDWREIIDEKIRAIALEEDFREGSMPMGYAETLAELRWVPSSLKTLKEAGSQ